MDGLAIDAPKGRGSFHRGSVNEGIGDSGGTAWVAMFGQLGCDLRAPRQVDPLLLAEKVEVLDDAWGFSSARVGGEGSIFGGPWSGDGVRVGQHHEVVVGEGDALEEKVKNALVRWLGREVLQDRDIATPNRTIGGIEAGQK